MRRRRRRPAPRTRHTSRGVTFVRMLAAEVCRSPVYQTEQGGVCWVVERVARSPVNRWRASRVDGAPPELCGTLAAIAAQLLVLGSPSAAPPRQ